MFHDQPEALAKQYIDAAQTFDAARDAEQQADRYRDCVGGLCHAPFKRAKPVLAKQRENGRKFLTLDLILAGTPDRLDASPWRIVMTRKNLPADAQRRPRVTHYEYVDDHAFCGARGQQVQLSPQEEDVTCRRCLHRIGIQDVAESGRRWA